MTPLSFIEVDQAAIRHNLAALKTLCRPNVLLCAVVKANAYGHGLAEAVMAIDEDVDLFAVDDLEELRQLRTITSKRALLLGFVSTNNLAEAVSLDVEFGVFDEAWALALQAEASRQGKKVRVHLKVDALLGRQGVLPSDATRIAKAISGMPNVEIVAAYSHFANLEDSTDLVHSFAQTEAFERAVQEIEASLDRKIGRHESATSGVMAREGEGSANDMVRVGIGLYGLYPSAALNRTHSELALRPALRWITHLAQVKALPARHPVGYGLTYITSGPTTIGIVPQGYSDGYDRGFSNASEVLVNGVRCAVLGRIAMNMFAVDLTKVPDAKVEDEVVLLGRSGEEEITAEELAQRIGTINYEIVARINPLLPRVAV